MQNLGEVTFTPEGEGGEQGGDDDREDSEGLDTSRGSEQLAEGEGEGGQKGGEQSTGPVSQLFSR